MKNLVMHSVGASTFRELAVKHMAESIEWVWKQSVLESGSDDKEYRQDWGFEFFTPHSTLEYIEQSALWAGRIADLKPLLGEQVSGLIRQMKAVAVSPLRDAYLVYMSVINTCLEKTRMLASKNFAVHGVSIALENNSAVHFSLPADEENLAYLDAASRLVGQIRAEGRWATVEEYCCIFAACEQFDSGSRLVGSAVAWKAPGFRAHQTLMSITDPGAGHLHGTCLTTDNLDGVIVHIEHLERGVQIPRAEVEPYRIPAPRVIPRVCLWTAGAAPVSTYVGRPMFDGQVSNSMLKTVHTFAAACNSFFASGITECKIAIEGMTATQAIHFLRSVGANVCRNKHRQILSAAFCLNVPIVDDRVDSKGIVVTDRYSIGKLGIEIAATAGIEKVTWDGTADSYPSNCIIEQISFAETLDLVHSAHEKGLMTYLSAGFRLNHIAHAVWTGVDGIGIGGAQILRYMDYTTGNHGPFKPDNIRHILMTRDKAEHSVRGIAAKLLARLDQMHHECSINEEQNKLRQELFDALKTLDDGRIETLFAKLEEVAALQDDGDIPALSSLWRVFSSAQARSSDTTLGREAPEHGDDWHVAMANIMFHNTARSRERSFV